MRVVPIACLKDNYAYLIVCESTGQAAVVDPSEREPVLEAVRREGVELRAIWNTHHHWDHTGGNEGLLAELGDLQVVAHGSDRGRVPGQTVDAQDGDEVALGDEVRAVVIHNPGHTSGAISYYVREPGAVFTGDTLFGGGCGRLFEGSPAQMLESLQRLAALPPETEVYCGHEYTAKNLSFAAAVEPDSADLAERRQRVDAQRAKGEPTVPFTIADERRTNPFLRPGEPAIVESVRRQEAPSEDSEVEVFAALRRWKDRF